MSFDLKKPTWRIYVHQNGCLDFAYFISTSRAEALKTAAHELSVRKAKGLRQRGSIHRHLKAELYHPAFGTDTYVRIEKWN